MRSADEELNATTDPVAVPRQTARVLGSARVVGLIEDTPDGPIEVYRGLRYATAERFRAPEVTTPQGTILALNVGAQAPQPADGPARSTSEAECLNLTIWRPAAAVDEPQPVLVWIHGGAHMYGSSDNPMSDGGRLAAREGLIVVAINYRLGALGHLWLADALGETFLDSGNLALLDQRAALDWVNAWIDQFGGDASRITVMGQSSGGVDVLAHVATHGRETPLHGAIVHSAGGERAMSLDEAIDVRGQLMRTIGLLDPRSLLQMDVISLMDAQEVVVRQRSEGRASTAIPFHPIVDHRFMTASPVDLITAGAGNNVPLIIGTNRNEASGWIDPRGDGNAVSSPLRDVLRLVQTAGLSAAYYRDRGAHPSAADVQEAVLAELMYRLPSQRVLEARRGVDATYSYVFDWKRSDGGAWPRGAGHSLELPFVFRHIDDSPDAFAEVGSDAPAGLADRMSAAWASFARTGKPASEEQWAPYRQGGTQMLWCDQPQVIAGNDGSIRRLVEATGIRYRVH